MVIGLVEKLDLSPLPAGIGKLLERSDDFRAIKFGLLEERAAHTEGDFKIRVIGDQLREHPGGGEIAFLCHFEKHVPVHVIPEEFIPLRVKPERLMKLKIKDRHNHGAPRYVIGNG